MMLAPNGEKLSKRHGAVSVTEYRDQGYSPRAVLNYLARFGWSHGDQEVFSLDELVARVRLGALQQQRRQVRREEVPRHRPRAPQDAAPHERRGVRGADGAVPEGAGARGRARPRRAGRLAHPRAGDHVRRRGRSARLRLPRSAGRRGAGRSEVPRPRERAEPARARGDAREASSPGPRRLSRLPSTRGFRAPACP